MSKAELSSHQRENVFTRLFLKFTSILEHSFLQHRLQQQNGKEVLIGKEAKQSIKDAQSSPRNWSNKGRLEEEKPRTRMQRTGGDGASRKEEKQEIKQTRE